MDIEKFSYVEALRWLANKYNIEIEETVSSPELKIQLQTSESLYIINNFAQKFFSEQLWDTEEGKDIALSYLKHRGFKEETIRKFQIGYNPEARDSFAMAASNAQFNTALLLKTGTVVQRDERLQDNYRGRIVFPIHNPSGKVLGFGARIIKKNDKAPKYINTPENEIYVKSKILYGTYFARMAIDKAKECLLVEGYTDVVSLHQAGVENVVASGGTSLTVDQLRLIKKYCDNLTIIYDGDGAGIKAALRGLDLALEERLNVKLVLIPDGEDPDSYVNKVGAEAFAKFVSENKKDFILFQLDIALKDAGTDSAKKATIVNQVAETISKINRAEDFTKRQDYVKQVAQVLKIDEAGLNTLVNKILRDRISKEDNKFNTASPVTAEENIDSTDTTSASTLFLSTEEQNEKALIRNLNEKALIRNLLEFGNNEWEKDETIAAYILKQIDPEDTFENPQLMEVFNLYKTWYLQGAKPTDKNFLYYENNELSNLVIGLMQSENEELSSKWKEKYESHIPTREDLYKEEVFSSLHYLKLRKIKKLIIENQLEMQQNPSVEQQIIMMQTHLELKELEMRITKELGTVIVK